jgi:hypothetical protein
MISGIKSGQNSQLNDSITKEEAFLHVATISIQAHSLTQSHSICDSLGNQG